MGQIMKKERLRQEGAGGGNLSAKDKIKPKQTTTDRKRGMSQSASIDYRWILIIQSDNTVGYILSIRSD
jgi:hypothetical protein